MGALTVTAVDFANAMRSITPASQVGLQSYLLS
jgi:hypothetical protein